MTASPDTPAAPRTRNPALDWMRAASIWYIVGFWHLFGYAPEAAWSPERTIVLYRVTTIVLALFVLISGYLLGQAKVDLGKKGLWRFYRKRLIRIYPPYLVALAIFAAGGILGASPVKAALLVSMVSPPPPFTLWFVTMIVLFYLIAPFLLAIVGRPALLVATVSLVWLALFALWRATGALDERLLMYLPVFVTGLLLARYPAATRPWLLVSVAALTAAGYVVSLRAPPPADRSLWLGPVAWAGSLLVFLAVNGRMPANRLVATLSAGSFFLYLFHRPIYVVAIKVVKSVGWGAPHAELVVLYSVAFPAAVIFGIVAQRMYDRLVDRFAKPRLASGGVDG